MFRVIEISMYRTLLDDHRLNYLRTLALMCNHLEGVAIEAGTYEGGSAAWIAQWMPEKTIYICDTFAGLPFEGSQGEHHKPGEFNCSYESVKGFIESQGDLKDRAILVKGYFPNSVKDFNIQKVAFCHLDLDYEAGTFDSLTWLHPRLSTNGIIVLDDYDWKHCLGVKRAAEYFVKINPQYVIVPSVHQQAFLFKRPI